MTSITKMLGLMFLSGAAASTAFAQAAPPWGDNFDSYSPGSGLAGQGGWSAWDDNIAADSLVTDQFAFSGANSILIEAASDTVMEFNTVTSGCWELSARQFIPSSYSGISYFLGLNTYDHGGPYHWSLQVNFDSATGMLTDDGTGASMPIAYDTWVPISAIVDIDGDRSSFSYDGTVLYNSSWTDHLNAGGAAAFGAIDLYANGSTAVAYDNVGFTQGSCGPTLSISGPCGGPGSVDMTGLTPNGDFAAVRGDNLSGSIIPGGPCAGQAMDLGNPKLLDIRPADANGEVHLNINLPNALCGRYVQIVDLTTCEVTNTQGPF